jgi:hydrogenase nickel incorporation protein HypB
MGSIVLKDKVLSKNDEIALENRALFDRHGLWCVNLISAPGSGKTTLVERTVDRLRGRLRIGVLVGDLQTENDARRIAAHGVPVRQIITGGACHLNAKTIGEFADVLGLDELDVLIIENVGNLVCPTSYHLGEHERVCLISTPEGDDKPLKYPGAIHTADAVLITKSDLAPYTDFDIEKARLNAWRIKTGVPVMVVSCKSGEGLEAWFDWFETHAREQNARRRGGEGN